MPYALHRAIEALLASLECASGGCKAAATRAAALALRRRQQATRRGGDDGLARREKPRHRLQAAGVDFDQLFRLIACK